MNKHGSLFLSEPFCAIGALHQCAAVDWTADFCCWFTTGAQEITKGFDGQLLPGNPGVPGVPGITVSGVPGEPGIVMSGWPGPPGMVVDGVAGVPGITVGGVPGVPAVPMVGVHCDADLI